MASSGDPELKGSFSISQWMKAKPNDVQREFEPFAASPPPHDDSFFYIRYPKSESLFPATKSKTSETTLLVQDSQTSAAALSGREVDWTKHTKPCQDVLHGFTAPITNTANLVAVKPKPAGTDDGFKGEGAACGSSVLKVAHKMVSSRTVSQRGFTVATPEEDEDATPPTAGSYNLSARRGSRSLPVSPLHTPPGSPNSRRRRNANRYFTSPFEPSDAINSRSWLTAALLGYKKDMDASTSMLAEEDVQTRLQGNTLMASVESLGPAPRERDAKILESSPQPTQEPKLTKPAPTFRPKPSEFRELNFWSPTSM